ncbi:hypothetical protein ACFFLM_03995 [Deinococcus oregonensis]|uniref:Uncharacterized protein n=1 Tax=Deinococcus oregonensis TaxID=1805970 RepID=A0ABV6AY42_9DEIO
MTEPDVPTVVQAPGTPPSSPAQPSSAPLVPAHPPASSVVPWGTLMVIGVLLLSLLWMWTLVLGIQQGRA